jgi:hypothetical protein
MGLVSVDVVHEMIRAGNDDLDELCEISGWPAANIKAAITQLGYVLDESDRPVKRLPASTARPQIVRTPDHDDIAARRQVDDAIDRQHEEDADAITRQRARELDTVAPRHPAPRPGPLVNAPTPLETLLVRGQQSPSKRTKALADRIDGLCTELTGRLRDEERAARDARVQAEAKAKAKADVERLEEQLAEARAKLRPAKKAAAKKAATKPPGNPLPPVPGESTSKIRAWALTHGHDVGMNGRLPVLIVMAYRQAHQPAESSAS